MAAKKVDALEERLEGEMNQIKTKVEERMSSMEGQVVDLHDMIKKMLEVHNQTAASVARSGEGKSTNSEIHKEEEEVEIVEGERRRPHLEPIQREERGGEYGGYHGRHGVDFEERRGEFEGGVGYGRAREDQETSRNLQRPSQTFRQFGFIEMVYLAKWAMHSEIFK
ncbi:hypothetical protein M5K25_021136 [Dendrobium thyrsiflorum]|uniref:Uncharacterized protein n=1 Tax=Dendrobium thyrsiflorum TaxID=117978 RepID=A0ABD0UBN1_DENTH